MEIVLHGLYMFVTGRREQASDIVVSMACPWLDFNQVQHVLPELVFELILPQWKSPKTKYPVEHLQVYFHWSVPEVRFEVVGQVS